MHANIGSKSPLRSHAAPVRQNFSLRSDDIPGAQPNRLIAVSKNILHYENKLSPDNAKFQNHLQRQPSLSKYEMLYGGEIVNGSPTAKHGKKLFPEHYNSEIHKTNAMKRDDDSPTHLLTFDYPRNLSTKDIPGAVSGSNKPKSVVNYDLAREIRRGNSVQKVRPEQPEFQARQVGDSLDRFQQHHNETHMRAKSTIHLDKVGSRPPSNHRKILNDNMFADEPRPYEQRVERDSLNSQVLPPSETNIYKTREETPLENYSPVISPTRSMPNYGREFQSNSPVRGHRIYQEEPENYSRNIDNNRRNDSASNLLKSGLHDNIRPAPIESPSWKEPVNDGRYSNSSKPTTGTTAESKKEEMKKIYTFDILSNKPTPKLLPANARLPYKYAIPFDVEQFSPPKNLRDISPSNLSYGNKAYNFLQPTNVGREGEIFQSAPVGKDMDQQKREQYLEMGHNMYNQYNQADQRDML